MLDIILLIVGIAGFGLASYFDLKYTEFPDLLPYGMILAVLIIRVLFSFYSADFNQLFGSIITGLLFLAIGLGIYLSKQWGDGDAWLLGVLGFFLPNNFFNFQNSILPNYLSLLLNFFLIAFFYIVIYSFAMGFNKKDVRKLFFKRIKGEARLSVLLSLIFFACYLVFLFYINYSIGIPARNFYIHLSFPFLIVFIVFFLQYAKSVESKLFKKKINVKELKPGDVIIGSRWKGLTEEEIKKIKRRGGTVWIKEGVRFAPVYLITLLVSVLVGGLLI